MGIPRTPQTHEAGLDIAVGSDRLNPDANNSGAINPNTVNLDPELRLSLIRRLSSFISPHIPNVLKADDLVTGGHNSSGAGMISSPLQAEVPVDDKRKSTKSLSSLRNYGAGISVFAAFIGAPVAFSKVPAKLRAIERATTAALKTQVEPVIAGKLPTLSVPISSGVPDRSCKPARHGEPFSAEILTPVDSNNVHSSSGDVSVIRTVTVAEANRGGTLQVTDTIAGQSSSETFRLVPCLQYATTRPNFGYEQKRSPGNNNVAQSYRRGEIIVFKLDGKVVKRLARDVMALPKSETTTQDQSSTPAAVSP